MVSVLVFNRVDVWDNNLALISLTYLLETQDPDAVRDPQQENLKAPVKYRLKYCRMATNVKNSQSVKISHV